MIGRIRHLEDVPFLSEEGKDEVKHFLLNIRDAKFTVKYDGCPAVFIGRTIQGEPFVSTKRFLNKTPVIYKTRKEILDSNYNLSVKNILLRLLEIHTADDYCVAGSWAVSGDLLFGFWTLRSVGYDWAFKPNVIEYRVPQESTDGHSIREATFGISWHTSYTTIPDFPNWPYHEPCLHRNPKMIWSPENESFRINGVDLDTSEEMMGVFHALDKFKYTPERGENIKKALNKAAVAGVPFSLDFYLANDFPVIGGVEHGITLAKNLIAMKKRILKQINNPSKLQTFLRFSSGDTKPTTHEGYVAVMKRYPDQEDLAIKLVEREVFTHYNISEKYIKGWI